LIVNFDPSRDERGRTTRLDETWQGLQDGGQVLMPQDEDPFSEGYGWVKRAQRSCSPGNGSRRNGRARGSTGRSFDVMNFHTYSTQAEMQRTMDYVRSTLARFGVGDRPIWVTETGYSSDPADQAHPGYQGGPGAQARWLQDHLPYLRQLGAAKVFWFKLYDGSEDPGAAHHGLLDELLRPKPAYYAYRDLVRSTP